MSSKVHSQQKIISTFITVRDEVSCLFRFTPGANYGAHGIQLHDGGLIQYDTTWYNPIQYNTIQFNTIYYNTIQ